VAAGNKNNLTTKKKKKMQITVLHTVGPVTSD